MNKKSTFRSVANNYLTHPKENNGITLIALIITVIILLILAGTAVSIALNGGDLFSKTSNAKNTWNTKVEIENSVLNSYIGSLDQYSGNVGNIEYNADAEHPWGNFATEEEVVPSLYSYEIEPQTTGKVEGVDGAYELGKVADTTGNLKLADNSITMGTVRIKGLNYDYIFKDIPGYEPGNNGTGTGATENESDPFIEAVEKYTKKFVIPATVKLNSSGQYDATGTEYKVIAIDDIGGYYSGFYGETNPYSYTVSGIEGKKAEMNIVIPYGVETIGEGAFYACSGLANILIPDSVTSIDDWAFFYCKGLTSIKIPNSVTSIGDFAFGRCWNLTNAVLPENMPNENVENMSSVFFDTGLTSITIPNNWTVIPYDMFRVSLLQNIVIPSNVTTICGCAFEYCQNLTSVTIPSSVTRINAEAFDGCENLTTINYTGTQTQWNAIYKGNKAIPSTTTIVYNYVPPTE